MVVADQPTQVAAQTGIGSLNRRNSQPAIWQAAAVTAHLYLTQCRLAYGTAVGEDAAAVERAAERPSTCRSCRLPDAQLVMRHVELSSSDVCLESGLDATEVRGAAVHLDWR
jgi:hypothetical protein